jgi:cell division protein FtsB
VAPKVPRRSGRRWVLYVLGGCAVLLWFHRSGIPTVLDLRDTWRQEKLREEKIQAIRQENSAIEKDIEELGPDGLEVERLARQELGLAKPGQTVIKIPDKK